MGCGCVDTSWEGLSWGCEAGARLGQQQFLLLRLLSRDPASPVGSWETQGWLGWCPGIWSWPLKGQMALSLPREWDGGPGSCEAFVLFSGRLPCIRGPAASGGAVGSALLLDHQRVKGQDLGAAVECHEPGDAGEGPGVREAGAAGAAGSAAQVSVEPAQLQLWAWAEPYPR